MVVAEEDIDEGMEGVQTVGAKQSLGTQSNKFRFSFCWFIKKVRSYVVDILKSSLCLRI